MGLIHAHEHGFYITCGVQGCPRSYSNYHSYKKHMYKKHRDVLELDICSDENLHQPLQPMETDGFELDDGHIDIAPQSIHSHNDEKRSSALFLMKAATMCKLSKSALDQLIDDFSLFLNEKVQFLEKEVRVALHGKGLELDADIASAFQSSSVTAPFQGLHTEFLRKKYYINSMGLLVSDVMCITVCGIHVLRCML